MPAAPASVPVARRRLTEELLEVGVFDAAISDAALVISELLSNAIRHARPLPGSWLQVTWIVAGDSVEVAVSDGGRPDPSPPGAGAGLLAGRPRPQHHREPVPPLGGAGR